MSAYGIFQFAYSGQGSHVQSMLADRNSLGSYLVLILGIGVGQWMGSRSRRRYLLTVVLGAVLICLVCANSRAAWVAAVFVLVIFVFLLAGLASPRLRLKLQLATASGLLLLSAGVLYRAWQLDVKAVPGGLAITRFWSTLNLRNPTGDILGRQPFWLAGLDAVSDVPAMGIGIGRFVSSTYVLERYGTYENAHNYFLQVGAELGLVGIILWLALLGQWFRHVRRQYAATTNEKERWGLVGLVLGVSGYLITCLTGHPLLLVDQQLLFWCAIGLGVSAYPVGRTSRTEKWWLFGWMTLLCVTLPVRHSSHSSFEQETQEILFTGGWYDREDSGDDWWYWAASRGELTLWVPEATTVSMRSDFLSMRMPNTVDIILNGKKYTEWAVEPPFVLSLPLEAGENRVELVSHQPAVKPDNDSRWLGIGIGNLVVTVGENRQARALQEQNGCAGCRIRFTSGWYDREDSGDDWWYWAASRGELTLWVPEATTVSMRSDFLSMRMPNTVDIILNGKKYTEWAVEPPFVLSLPLEAGENRVELVSHQPAVKPDNDSRWLGIGIGNLVVTVGENR